MSLPPENYMCSCRKRAGLTQSDIAYLLSYSSQTFLSELENGFHDAPLHVVLAFQLLFDMSPGTLFPRKALEIEKKVRVQAGKRAKELCDKDQCASVKHRVELLRQIESGQMPKIIFHEDQGPRAP